jgi:polyisoprenoid-binding protein YceI
MNMAVLRFIILGLIASLSTVTLATDYRIDSDASYIHVFTDRAGPLKALSHYHVIELAPISGQFSFTHNQPATAELTLEPASFRVDAPEATALYPDIWSKAVSEGAAKGTQKNMLSKKLLFAEAFPEIKVSIALAPLKRIEGNATTVTFQTRITLKDSEFEFSIPGTLETTPDALIAQASVQISHKDLGLKPFKAGAGAIAVGKELNFLVYIHATPILE